MAQLVWDAQGSRTFEAGLSHGILFPTLTTGIAWNGLTGVDEDHNADSNSTPYYLDGVKYLDDVDSSDYSAVMTAFTYPDEFVPFNGTSTDGNGLILDGQSSRPFNLCYRTRLGDDINGTAAGYKIHMLYNVTATPTNRAYVSTDSTLAPIEFSWNLVATPVPAPGFRPTAHAVVNTRKTTAAALTALETILYGSVGVNPRLPLIAELLTIV